MVLGQHRRMWLEAMRQTEQRVYGFGSLKDGYALVGIHLRKQKCCLKKGTTSNAPSVHPGVYIRIDLLLSPDFRLTFLPMFQKFFIALLVMVARTSKLLHVSYLCHRLFKFLVLFFSFA